jgi:hypothetical protein
MNRLADDWCRRSVQERRHQAVAQEAVQSAWSIARHKLGKIRDPARAWPWLMTVAVT